MPEIDDLVRLRKEYADRSRRLKGKSIYSYFERAYLFSMQQRERVILTLIAKFGFQDLSEKYILEIGCGGGGVLVDFLRYGASQHRLSGIDILYDRLIVARDRLPGSILANSDGQFLPFNTETFDLALQYTAFSSILDAHIKQNVAREMLRVIKPGGLIIWYDFWLNPSNRQTRGIRLQEIRELFPGCDYEVSKTTLAPPLARRIVPLNWGLASFMESLKVFNSHYLVIIQPQSNAF